MFANVFANTAINLTSTNESYTEINPLNTEKVFCVAEKYQK